MKEKLIDKVKNMGLKNIPYSEDINVLKSKINFGSAKAENRIAIQPMEGCDGEKNGIPGELTKRRYLRFAESGAGIIWFEATAIVDEGRANPRQLFMNKNNTDAFKRLTDDIKNTAVKKNGYAPIVIMQATHSGRYSKPNGYPEPIIGYNNPIFEKENPIDKSRIITDDKLKELEERYGTAAYEAQKAGFDGVDIKCCHRYLASEMLSAYTREGEFGGSFENRTRLIVNGIKNAKSAAGKDFIVTTRLNVYDGFEYPYGFGVKNDGTKGIDLDEPKKLIDILCNQLGVNLMDITIGNPYVNAYVNRPSNSKINLETENPLIGVDRMYYCIREIQSAFPNLTVIGSGVSYFGEECLNLAAGAVKENYCKIQGFGRMSFAYPEIFKDAGETGKIDGKKCCIACGKCTELMRAGTVTGCVIRDSEVYMPYYREFCMNK